MKPTQKNQLLIALLFFIASFYTSAMKHVLPEKKFISTVGDIILEKENIQTLLEHPPFEFTQLLPDLQNTIINLLTIETTSTSLKSAAITINTLAHINKELNALINDPTFCLKIIKHLSHKFELFNFTFHRHKIANADMKVAKILQTQEAKRRVEIQKKLYNLCTSAVTVDTYETFISLCKQGVDLNFTYVNKYDPYENILPLQIALNNKFTHEPSEHALILAGWLITNGANPNEANNEGKTALMECARYFLVDAVILLTPYCKKSINYQDVEGYTALHCVILEWLEILLEREEEEYPDIITIIETLLDAGADPEIANNKQESPLSKLLARDNKGEAEKKVIDLLQNAIDKKQGKK